MKETFRLSMAWLHTWSGLVIGWVLYVMFLAGTAALFQDETSVWMRPELGSHGDPATAVELAQRRLESVAPQAQSWSISLPDAREPATQISWRPRAVAMNDNASTDPATRELLDSSTGEPLRVRQTRGGDLFYRLHYRFEIQGRNGWWFSGAAAVAMLVGLVSGVIIHKRIFRDFFTFRSKSALQRSWLDAHNFLAVLLLPFHFVITYTGLVPIMSTVMPWAIVANYAQERTPYEAMTNYGEVRTAYFEDARGAVPGARASGVAASLVPLRPVLEQARQRWDGGRVGRISVTNPGDSAAVIEVVRHAGDQVSHRGERLLFAGDSGRFMRAISEQGVVSRISSVMYGLHMVRFADPVLRWVVFIAGLASTAMIAAGLILWTVKRRPDGRNGQPVPLGYAIVERLNVGTIVGLPVAMAGLFWANRLLPIDMAARPATETRVFFGVWLFALLYAAVRPAKRLWSEQLWMAVFAFAAVPVLNAFTTDRHLLASVRDGDWIMAGFDLTMIGVALLFAFAATKASQRVPAGNCRERSVPGKASQRAQEATL